MTIQLSEELQVEILLVFGTVMHGGGRWYWQRVYDYLKTRHPDIVKGYTQWPGVTDYDMQVLMAIFNYQKELEGQKGVNPWIY